MSFKKEIAIFGAGGFGLETAMLIEHINEKKNEWEIVGFFDDGVAKGKMRNGHKVLGGIADMNRWKKELYIAMALGSPENKKIVVEKINNPNIKFPTLIHPTAIVGKKKYITIGEGSIICAGTIITTNVCIGKHIILNLGCTIGHESSIGDYSSFMPSCNISGEVNIGKNNFWGTGAKIINKRSVGDNVIIGAGAVVINNIPDNVTAVGVPAKIVKKG